MNKIPHSFFITFSLQKQKREREFENFMLCYASYIKTFRPNLSKHFYLKDYNNVAWNSPSVSSDPKTCPATYKSFSQGLFSEEEYDSFWMFFLLSIYLFLRCCHNWRLLDRQGGWRNPQTTCGWEWCCPDTY